MKRGKHRSSQNGMRRWCRLDRCLYEDIKRIAERLKIKEAE